MRKMGCFSLQCLVAAAAGASKKVKVMTMDGQCLKFEAPIHVKEVLIDHPGHAIFHSSSSAACRNGRRARPLQPTLHLQPGQLYFLVPLPPPKRRDECCTARRAPSSSSPYVRSQAQREGNSPSTRGVIFASSGFNNSTCDDPSLYAARAVHSYDQGGSAAVREGFPSVSASKSSCALRSGYRLKVVVSQKQLASILLIQQQQQKGIGHADASMVENLLIPLLKEADLSKSDDVSEGSPTFMTSRSTPFQTSSSSSSASSWRPGLESIPEAL